jgi:hypothetical protein
LPEPEMVTPTSVSAITRDSTRYVLGKNYYVSKQFYRHVRPGAVRVGATVSGGDSDTPTVFVTTYVGPAPSTNFTAVIINLGDDSVTVSFKDSAMAVGHGEVSVNNDARVVPEMVSMYQTTATQDHTFVGVLPTDSIVLQPNSVSTVVTYVKPGGV